MAAVYCTLFAIGKLLFGEYLSFGIFAAIALASFGWIARSLRAQGLEGTSAEKDRGLDELGRKQA